MRAEGQAGKLIGAAEHWFNQGKTDDHDFQDDAAFYNIVLDQPAAPSHFEVWPENWETVCLFLRCTTQWRVTMQGVMGLDYGAVEALLRLYSVDNPCETFEGLQEMEARAVELINEATQKATQKANRRGR